MKSIYCKVTTDDSTSYIIPQNRLRDFIDEIKIEIEDENVGANWKVELIEMSNKEFQEISDLEEEQC